MFISWGSWEIYTSVKAANFPQWEAIIPLLIGAFKAVIGLSGVFALISRKAFFANLCAILYKISIRVFVAQFVVQWVFWILNMLGIMTSDGQKWHPSNSEIAQMVTFTLVNAVFFLVCFWILSTFRSLHMVLLSKGNGWERKNFKDIRLDNALKDEDEEP